jgi:RNAse (barnase) inhibitor barstar
MKTILLETNSITDWNSFHSQFATLMGFPDFYGRNMNAWIDCMSYLTAPNEKMSKIHLENGEALVIQISHTNDFRKRMPEIYDELIYCVVAVNNHFAKRKESSVVALAFL